MGKLVIGEGDQGREDTASTPLADDQAEASSTPSCFAASGLAVLSAPLSNHQPTQRAPR